MSKKAFFSWQSDIDGNKQYLEKVLQDAARLSKDVEIDSAERDPEGADDIAKVILDKIESSSFFIADVSIINPSADAERKTSNPNVLYELGYAMKALGKERIILIANKATTTDTKYLPFDIRNRRVMLRNFQNNGTGMAKEILVIFEKLGTLAKDDGPYVYLQLQSVTPSANQITFTAHSFESKPYHLESIEIEGTQVVIDRNIEPNKATESISTTGLLTPPFETDVEGIYFVISSGRERWKVFQQFRLSGRADEKYNLDKIIEKPSEYFRL